MLLKSVRHNRQSTSASSRPSAFATRRYSTSSGGNDSVLLEKHDHGIRVLKFNNPTKMNALTEDSGRLFRSYVNEISKDKATRAVILTGQGKAFSAGGDLEFLVARTKDTPHNNSFMMRKFYGRFLSFRDSLKVPVITAINGAAVGAGFCLALATDMRLTTKEAKMGLNFVSLGLHPGMAATYYLPRLVGHQIATRLLLTGDLITGEEAKNLGLVLEAYDTPEKLQEQAFALAKKIADQSPEAVAATLHTLRWHNDEDLSKALQREADGQSQSYSSKQILEGLEAVKAKRKPKFE